MRKGLLFFMMCFVAMATSLAQEITITEIGRYTDGREDALEIVTYDSTSQQIFITNAASDSIDIVDVSDPTNPTLAGHIDVLSYGGGVNSIVSLNNGYIAAAIEADVKQDSGKVVFYDVNGNYANHVTVGALPDMITVNAAGTKVVVANEGEPDDDYLIDPDGSVSIIDISAGVMNVTQNDVMMVGFGTVTSLPAGALQKPGTTIAQDFEPEYLTIVESLNVVVGVCQESNVVFVVDLNTGVLATAVGLGFKDHSLEGNGIDASNEDGGINIQNWPVKGVYQPDAIASYTVNGTPYLLTANEGDGRDYDSYSSETRIKDLTLDSVAFPNAAALQQDDSLGRLKTFTPDVIGDTDGDGDVDELYSYGARSFTIWTTTGSVVWDSGDEFEQYIAANEAAYFNCNDGLASKSDSRSDDKGPEPEAITVGYIDSNYYAFIGLERQSGIMVYNITDPTAPYFVDFINSYQGDTTMTDVSPEGLIFIHKDHSHTGQHLLMASHEISGTTTIFRIDEFAVNTEEVLETPNSFKIFPNPSNQALVYFDDMMTVTVFDMMGRRIKKVINTNFINTEDWQTGTYIFVNEQGQKQLFVKMK